MTSPTSGSDAAASRAFDRLHPRVQRWIWQRGWDSLRDVQEQATHAILERRGDVIISAATASGKTEAAFLPICSRLVDDGGGSIRALYVGPLKALINDQFGRLEELCAALEIPVHRWHGDVSATRKRELVKDPGGILLITPESLEALFVHRGSSLSSLFARLDDIVVDELHAFVGTARGRQLQSQLSRLEHVLQRRVPRVGLSATLGDLGVAAEYLRPGHGGEVVRIVSDAASQSLRLQVRGYFMRAPPPTPAGDAPTDAERPGEIPDEVVAHLFKTLRGSSHLVFANSRRAVEELTDGLTQRCERERVPNEFLAHHGKLSRELRHDAEAMLKREDAPLTVVCTSTLEMGIDIGRVASVAQVGVPPSVATLRQRLGRSGRRGDAAVLRAYVCEDEIDARTPLRDELRAALVETIGMVDLLLARWCEPTQDAAMELTALVQQLASMIAQHGGVRPKEAWHVLCEGGPFRAVDPRLFADVLRALAKSDIVVQEPDGTLLLGVTGERVVNHYSFYSVFETPEEYRVMNGTRPLGTIPRDVDLREGVMILFAGRRWQVDRVDDDHKVVEVSPARGARRGDRGGGGGFDVHDRVRARMYELYGSTEVPVYLDASARELLREGRANFARRALDRVRLCRDGDAVAVLPWRGTRVVRTLTIALRAIGHEASHDGLLISVARATPDTVRGSLAAIVAGGVPDPAALAATLDAPPGTKFDRFLNEELRRRETQVRDLDVQGAWAAARELADAPVV